MSQCKVDSCRSERAPGKSRCAHHHDLYERRRVYEARLPRCNTQGCGNTARSGDVLCGHCIDIADELTTRKAMTLEERLSNLERHVFGE